MNHGQVRRVGRARRRGLFIALSLVAMAVMLGAASSALATPKGAFAVFSDCPVTTPGVTVCTFGQTTGGEFKIGSTSVPINKTITLQGGAIKSATEPNTLFLVPAKDGNSLSKTELNVPGGLTSLIDCTAIKGEGLLEKAERGSCKAIFENKVTGVTAETELVANASNPPILNAINILTGTGTGLTLPVRVHLRNPLLGSGCYIGSEASPIQLHLTSGTTSPPPPNKPISGNPGIATTEEEGQIVVLTENALVDNAFSAPAAEGCGGIFAFLLDPILDAKTGLPAKAGVNTAILTGVQKIAPAAAVVASEK
jgi:hypothetical protein